MNVAPHSATGENLDTRLGFDAAEELAVYFNFPDFDIGMNNGMFTDGQIVTSRNRSLKVAVDAKRAGEFECARHISTTIQKTGQLIGLLQTKFHNLELPVCGLDKRIKTKISLATSLRRADSSLQRKRNEVRS